MNELQAFAFEDHLLRRTEKNGESLFVAKDVCGILEIQHYRDAISDLDDDERASVLVDTLGGKQDMVAVTESGLYSLIFRSRKPIAKQFRRWVTHEVLPQIRKTGAYAMPDKLQEVQSLIDAYGGRISRAALSKLVVLKAKACVGDTSSDDEDKPLNITSKPAPKRGSAGCAANASKHFDHVNEFLAWAYPEESRPAYLDCVEIYDDYIEFCSQHGATPLPKRYFFTCISVQHLPFMRKVRRTDTNGHVSVGYCVDVLDLSEILKE